MSWLDRRSARAELEHDVLASLVGETAATVIESTLPGLDSRLRCTGGFSLQTICGDLCDILGCYNLLKSSTYAGEPALDWADSFFLSPPSEELESVESLVACQINALTHVRRLAKRNHEKALPGLYARAEGLNSLRGLSEEGGASGSSGRFSSKKRPFTKHDINSALLYIRDVAPIIVHFNPVKVAQFYATDTHYRNGFETSVGCYSKDTNSRITWENELFNGAYGTNAADAAIKARPFDRVKYGSVNIVQDPRGVKACVPYGDSYIVLRRVRLRTTFSNSDTSGVKGDDMVRGLSMSMCRCLFRRCTTLPSPSPRLYSPLLSSPLFYSILSLSLPLGNL